MTITQSTLSLDDAKRLIGAAEAKAKVKEIGMPFNIAVVDAGGNLVAFARMDGTWLGRIDIAQGKAFTAKAFDMPTGDLATMAQPGKPLFEIAATNHQHVATFGHGVPVQAGGGVVGAVGVSGGMVDQDQAVAEAAVEAFG